MKRSLLALLLLVVGVFQAFAAFGYYSPITVNNGQVPSTQTDFPILISQTDNRFKTTGNGGHVANSNGYDIRPYSDAALTTALTFELERYNATTGEVIMYVKRSSLSDGNVTYLGYGNASLNTDGSSTSTWSNSFTAVYNLKDGTTLSVADSTGSHNGSNQGATATTGKIDGAANFVSASTQYIDLPSNLTTTAVTLSGWINATSFPQAYQCVGGWDDTTFYATLMVKSTGKLACYTKASAEVKYDGTGANTLSAGTTYFLAMTYDSTAGLIGYVNAGSDATVAANGNLATSGSVGAYIGKDIYANRTWNGMIDEFRISSVGRSQNWITIEYNEGFPGTFETLGTEIAVATGNSRFFYFLP